MSRNFDLTFTTDRGDFRIPISMEKSFTERVSLKVGYAGKPVKFIKVVPKDDAPEKITSRKHIAHVCDASELQSIYPTGEQNSDGEDEYVVVDKQSLKNMFPSSKEMRVIRTVPSSSIPFHYLCGQHYALNVRQEKKGKTRVANPEDEALYALVHGGLSTNNEVFVVRYCAQNNNKYAVIFADVCGLRMSNLIASDYQKKRTASQKLGADCAFNPKSYSRLVRTTHQHRLKADDFTDDYNERLEKLIESAIAGEVYKPKKSKIPVHFSRLAVLDADSDSEEEIVQKKKRARKS